ncbi:hypothetical protein [Acidianus sp. HS-5]|uniref:hypothetical protein n=1 Tax=Acidianus sp. HS-5 TaxID=2886040 RepID=UPI001F35C41B|nr:hypothetical protein [Acidianus sp. HS-5]BDC19117.1 hypothetical protein HS5_20070 [Acidianus sp. HS-5]
MKNDKIELVPISKEVNYRGIFKVNFSKDVDRILEDAIKERSKKWIKDILT